MEKLNYGSPLQPPPLYPIFIIFIGLPVWGYLCGRVTKITIGLPLMFLPYLISAIFVPGLLSPRALLYAFLWPYLVPVALGYAVGFLHKERPKKEEAPARHSTK